MKQLLTMHQKIPTASKIGTSTEHKIATLSAKATHAVLIDIGVFFSMITLKNGPTGTPSWWYTVLQIAHSLHTNFMSINIASIMSFAPA